MTREETLNRFKKWCQEQLGNHCSDKDAQMANNIMALLEQESCEDAISRQAVLDIDFNRIIHTTAKPAEMIRQKIEQLSTVNPQPKTGHWISYMHGAYYECSNCKERNNRKDKYCPNCEAKMVESEVEE